LNFFTREWGETDRRVTGVREVCFVFGATAPSGPGPSHSRGFYEGWNFNSGNYLFTTDTK